MCACCVTYTRAPHLLSTSLCHVNGHGVNTRTSRRSFPAQARKHSFAFLLQCSTPIPPYLASLQTMLGGWDQSQYGYWASNMSDRFVAQGIGKAHVQRAQNDFDKMEQVGGVCVG